MHLFFVLFSFGFRESPTMLLLKIYKQCINVCFVSIVMLSISKLTCCISNMKRYLHQRWSDSGFLLSDPILFLKNDIRIRSESCLVKILLSVSENYLKVYYDTQHTFFV